MADPEPPKKVKKLPPLTKAGDDTEGEKKVVKKKKKKPTTETNGTTSTPTKEGTPRKKKKPATPKTNEDSPKAKENGEASTTETKQTPRKRKKRKATGEEEQKDPTSARSQGEDVTGSQANLITKDQSTGGTPKKKGKKKVKKTPRTSTTPREEDEFLDATFAADLTTIQEDIVMPSTDKTEKDEEEGEEEQRHPYSTEAAVLKSQPLQKLFIETDSGFRGQDKARHAKKMADEQAYKADIPVQETRTTIELALSTQNVLNTGYLFIHGLTAGISVWQILMTYVLLGFPYLDFIEHYRAISLPVHCLFYILLLLCTLSSCDRFDVGHITRRFVIQSITLQTGTVAVVIYFAAMVVSLSAAGFEDKMYIFGSDESVWNNTAVIESEFTTWQNLNVARCALAILGWLAISIVPSTQRLADNLKEGEDNLLDTRVDMMGSNA